MPTPNFDKIIPRKNTHSQKWDGIASRFGVTAPDALPMWVADMDFAAPPAVLTALKTYAEHGVFGYYGDYTAYHAAICNWMKTQHDWQVDPSHIFATHGVVNGLAVCLQAFSQPRDAVMCFTPVYHGITSIIVANDRELVQCKLAHNNGRYEMDFDAYEAQMTGRERIVIACSPHNPGGRVWEAGELRELADFCIKHDLILLSDEVHHDLILDDVRHIPMCNAAPDIANRLVMLTAASKTFNLAAGYVGNVIIADDILRERFARANSAAGNSPNSFGLMMAQAAYEDGGEWLADLRRYIAGNRDVFDLGIAGIPGLESMRLAATYLAWVDFSGTGMTEEEVLSRVQTRARIVANHGATFGDGGEGFLRFNLAAPRAVIDQAVARLQEAFADLQ